MKQPHEDILGIDRSTDALVSLEEQVLAVRDALCFAGLRLYHAVCCNTKAPLLLELEERILHPRPGDYVAIVDTPQKRAHRSGYLIERRREWWHTDEEWVTVPEGEDHAPREEWGADKRPVDRAIYIQYGPEPIDYVRWVSAQVYGLLIQP